jgi:hypothetical protein
MCATTWILIPELRFGMLAADWLVENMTHDPIQVMVKY